MYSVIEFRTCVLKAQNVFVEVKLSGCVLTARYGPKYSTLNFLIFRCIIRINDYLGGWVTFDSLT